MKSKKIIFIISLTYLILLFPVNLMSQDLFTAKEELTVFEKASIKSDSIYTIHINDEVEVLEVKNVWFKKWAKIQKSDGEQGYVLFLSLKPINANQEIKENNTNNEDVSAQNTTVKEEYSEPQKEESQNFEQESVNTSNEYTETNTTLNHEQENNVSQADEKSNKSFPTWGWFAILGTIVLGYSTYLYKKHLYEKFTYNIFSLSTIVSLLLSFGTISFLNYSINHSETGVMWGIPSDTFKFLLITALILTIGILYYYNLRKTNWYLAIINVIIQTVAVGIFVVLLIGWIILKILSSKSSTEGNSSTSTSSTNTNSTTKCIIRQRFGSGVEWEYDGKILRQRFGSGVEWEYDGKVLRQRFGSGVDWEYDGRVLRQRFGSGTEWEYDGRILRRRFGSGTEWEYDGRILRQRFGSGTEWETQGYTPIPVLAKATRII
jgi:hypothetical protein